MTNYVCGKLRCIFLPATFLFLMVKTFKQEKIVIASFLQKLLHHSHSKPLEKMQKLFHMTTFQKLQNSTLIIGSSLKKVDLDLCSCHQSDKMTLITDYPLCAMYLK